jgi:hypothetical protein
MNSRLDRDWNDVSLPGGSERLVPPPDRLSQRRALGLSVRLRVSDYASFERTNSAALGGPCSPLSWKIAGMSGSLMNSSQPS